MCLIVYNDFIIFQFINKDDNNLKRSEAISHVTEEKYGKSLCSVIKITAITNQSEVKAL